MVIRRSIMTLSLWGILCAVLACGAVEEPVGGNVLLLVADDLGVDKVGAYGEHPTPPRTPNLDALAARGVVFRNAYTYPSCSPARAAMLTGRFGRRTGLGFRISMPTSGFEMPLRTLTIPAMLDQGSGLEYDHALAGKWHLAGFRSPSNLTHPAATGFRRFAGSAGNLNTTSENDGTRYDYYRWEKITDGKRARVERYATTVTVDDALDFVAAMREPWFLMVAFNAPHRPVQLPPVDLHSRPVEEIRTKADTFDAMVEALDTEIGRLLAGIEPAILANTTVLFIGDNGTSRFGVTPPLEPRQAKETLYEGGTNVPLIVAGPAVAVPGSESAALVHAVDIFATVADIAGVRLERLEAPNGGRLVIDGRSLLPYLRDPGLPSQREYLYTEVFEHNGPPPYRRDERSVRDLRWKLIRRASQPDEFFDLEGRLDDGPDLLVQGLDEEARTAYDRLAAELERFTNELTYEGF